MSSDDSDPDSAMALGALVRGLDGGVLDMVKLAEPPFNVLFDIGTDRQPASVRITHLKQHKASHRRTTDKVSIFLEGIPEIFGCLLETKSWR
jgi:hypothetical protein